MYTGVPFIAILGSFSAALYGRIIKALIAINNWKHYVQFLGLWANMNKTL